MKPESRAVIAFLAGSLISDQNSSSIYDYTQGKSVSISGTISESINVYNYDQGCYITGNRNGSKYSIYHYGDSHYIDLEINGNKFKGYDYGSGKYYSGSVEIIQ